MSLRPSQKVKHGCPKQGWLVVGIRGSMPLLENVKKQLFLGEDLPNIGGSQEGGIYIWEEPVRM